METANRALELARRAEDGEVEGRVLGVMELIKGVQKQVQEIPEQMFVQDGGPQGQADVGSCCAQGSGPSDGGAAAHASCGAGVRWWGGGPFGHLALYSTPELIPFRASL